MGMFDNIKCAHPKPDGYTGKWFQTKDLDCRLDTFEITPEGELIRTKSYNWETEKQDTETVKIPFHGILNFYDIERGQWHEYNAKFTEGKLVEISQGRG